MIGPHRRIGVSSEYDPAVPRWLNFDIATGTAV